MNRRVSNACLFSTLILVGLVATDESLLAQEIDFFEMPHHLSLLIADTHIDGEGNNETFGIDYEYRWNELLGLGVVVEHSFGELDATTVLAVADVHLHEGWIMQVGPGYEFKSEENVSVARVGILYEFEFESWTLSPQLHWDWHQGEENAVVGGLAIGFAF